MVEAFAANCTDEALAIRVAELFLHNTLNVLAAKRANRILLARSGLDDAHSQPRS